MYVRLRDTVPCGVDIKDKIQEKKYKYKFNVCTILTAAKINYTLARFADALCGGIDIK